ncbi:MAG: SPFH domain-containing protein [Armatimonadetes bacterium]|nr:SPFH domain-containing protein [Armatimonadota bacterium]
MSEFFSSMVFSFIAFLIGMPILGAIARGLGVYTIVEEGRCHVYVLFGKVVSILEEPGLYFLWARLGPRAMLIPWFGRCHVVDMRLDQRYLRSQAVNSEEGAPMGIGIWYEMFISDPIAYLFKNADPQGSLAANVSNAVVRCLSNMPLANMMENRHGMSQAVRAEVSPKSKEWGYSLGSVYIRKVHFRDSGMIRQIEEKVVNRLRQVTAAIRQDGANQVSIITSTAERQAAIEFAKAQAIRPSIVGAALQKIVQDREVAGALFEVLETEKLLHSGATVTLLPKEDGLMSRLLAATEPDRALPPPASPKEEGKGPN